MPRLQCWNAERSGNALDILLAATRISVGPEDPDTLSLVDSALTVHSQLTRDVGAAMSATVMAQRQIWLAQTFLPEGVSRDLTRMPVASGRVFHSTCLRRQSSLVVRGSQSVALLVGRPIQRTSPDDHTPSHSSRAGAGRGTRTVEFAVPRVPQRQPAFWRTPPSGARPQGRRPPRATEFQGNTT